MTESGTPDHSGLQATSSEFLENTHPEPAPIEYDNSSFSAIQVVDPPPGQNPYSEPVSYQHRQSPSAEIPLVNQQPLDTAYANHAPYQQGNDTYGNIQPFNHQSAVNTGPLPGLYGGKGDYSNPEGVETHAKDTSHQYYGPVLPNEGQKGDGVPRTRRNILLWVSIAALVAAGLTIGLAVGLTMSHSHSSNSSNTTPTTVAKSACRGIVCPQTLAAAVTGTTLMIFSRWADNNIWYTSATTNSSSPWPTSSPTWTNLGGPALSPPSVMAWEPSQISVLVVWDPDSSVRTKRYLDSSSSWNSSWENLFGQTTSAVSLCTVNETRLDAWMIDASSASVDHDFWVATDGDFFAPAESNSWQGSANFSQKISAKPGIACRENQVQHDLLVYDAQDGTLMHSTWSGSTFWTPPVNLGGNFTSDPVALASSAESFVFFGVGVDGAIYHINWTSTTGYSSLINLGGSFQSVPSAVITSSGRIDLVALGTDDLLKHKAYTASGWSSEWDDLGVFSNSAPLLVDLSTSPEQIGLVVLGTGGELNYTAWTVSSDVSWGNLVWSNIGGNATAAYFGV